jgi:hypothetical protein
MSRREKVSETVIDAETPYPGGPYLRWPLPAVRANDPQKDGLYGKETMRVTALPDDWRHLCSLSI